MGQDSSCGICGKHYQACNHYRKTHLNVTSLRGEGVFCNPPSGNILRMNERQLKDCSTDPHDLCKKCIRIYEKKNNIKVLDKTGNYTRAWESRYDVQYNDFNTEA